MTAYRSIPLMGVRIVQVEPGTKVGEHIVDDEHGVQDGLNVIYVTARHYEKIKAASQELGHVTYDRR